MCQWYKKPLEYLFLIGIGYANMNCQIILLRIVYKHIFAFLNIYSSLLECNNPDHVMVLEVTRLIVDLLKMYQPHTFCSNTFNKAILRRSTY